MSLFVTTNFKAHLAQPYQSTTTIWFVKLPSGTVLGFTSHAVDLTYNLASYLASAGLSIPEITGSGAVLYRAATGYKRTDIEGMSDLSVDNGEVDGILNSPSITEADLHAGLWDFAFVCIAMVNYKDLTNSMGAIVLRAGNLGEVTLERNTFKAELRGRTQAYSRVLGELTQPGCRAELYDSRCKQSSGNAPAWIGAHIYAVGDVVSPSPANGFQFVCKVAGTSGGAQPAWVTTMGATTNDGATVQWTTRGSYSVSGSITGFSISGLTLYDTSRTEPGPTGSTTITAVTNSNPCHITVVDLSTFFNAEAVTLSAITGMPLLNTSTLIRNKIGNTFDLGIDTTNTGIYGTYGGGGVLTPLGGTSGWFDFGVMTMTSGANAGLSREVMSYVPGQMALFLPFPYAMVIGDTYTMKAGCDKAFATCKAKFNNVVNFRGEPYLPGIDKVVQIGKQP